MLWDFVFPCIRYITSAGHRRIRWIMIAFISVDLRGESQTRQPTGAAQFQKTNLCPIIRHSLGDIVASSRGISGKYCLRVNSDRSKVKQREQVSEKNSKLNSAEIWKQTNANKDGNACVFNSLCYFSNYFLRNNSTTWNRFYGIDFISLSSFRHNWLN